MFHNGEIVSVVPSEELIEMGLMGLALKVCKVVEVCYARNNQVRGAWIELLEGPYLDEREWYIPIKSIKHEQD